MNVRIIACGGEILNEAHLPHNVSLDLTLEQQIATNNWSRLRLGEKVSSLLPSAQADYITFITQFDFPNYDAFSKALDWFSCAPIEREKGVYVGGFYQNDLTLPAPSNSQTIFRNNSSDGLYRWSQNSLAEHQLATLMFGKKSTGVLNEPQIERLDVLLPVSIIAACEALNFPLHRSRHILYRIQVGHFHRHYDAYKRAVEKGFWAQH